MFQRLISVIFCTISTLYYVQPFYQNKIAYVLATADLLGGWLESDDLIVSNLFEEKEREQKRENYVI